LCNGAPTVDEDAVRRLGLETQQEAGLALSHRAPELGSTPRFLPTTRFSRITVNPDQMGGVRCLRGMRIPKAFEQRRVVDAIREQLIQENPRRETRNKFALDPPPDCADHELRVGNLRVMYREKEDAGTIRVIVALIGRKNRNKLIVEGEEFDL